MSITLSELTAGSTHLAGNDIWVKAKTSGIPEGASDYKILLKIVSADDVLTGSPFVDAIAPDASGEAWFNFSGYVNQGIRRELTWPIPTLYEGKITGWVNQAYDVWLYGGERYIDSSGDLVENFGETPLQPFFIVPGKLPVRLLAELNDLEKTWWKNYCYEGNFFTLMPTTQTITPYQPVKLWWMAPELLEEVNVFINYYHDNKEINEDGDHGTTTFIFNATIYYDILYEIDLHIEGTGIPLISNLGNKLKKIEVWIEDDAVEVTERRTFLVKWDPPVNKYYYLFVDNQIGGIDCIGLTGRCVLKASGERSVVAVPFELGGGVKNATRLIKPVARKRQWEINSGWKTKAELEAMEFLLDAPQAWLAIPPADGSTAIKDYKLTPVIITNTELVLGNDMEDVESIDIELTEAL